MAVQLRSGKEVRSSEDEKKERSEQEEKKETGEEDRKNNLEWTAETENKVHIGQHEKNYEQKQKEKVQAYPPTVPFPQRLQKEKNKE